MKTIFFACIMILATLDSDGQTLSVDDLVKGIRQCKEYKTIKVFLEKRGFEFDTMLLPGAAGKLYSFMGQKEYMVKGINGDTLQMKNAVFVRMEDAVTLRKLTLMTASREYYEGLVADLVVKKFKAKEHQDKSKPMAYTSELFAGIAISLSVVEAVKDGKPYARYQVSANY